jgi:hypothetical protein
VYEFFWPEGNGHEEKCCSRFPFVSMEKKPDRKRKRFSLLFFFSGVAAQRHRPLWATATDAIARRLGVGSPSSLTNVNNAWGNNSSYLQML